MALTRLQLVVDMRTMKVWRCVLLLLHVHNTLRCCVLCAGMSLYLPRLAEKGIGAEVQPLKGVMQEICSVLKKRSSGNDICVMW